MSKRTAFFCLGTAACAVALLTGGPISAQSMVEQPPEKRATASAWETLAATDLAFLDTAIARNYIYANYKSGPDWERLRTDALKTGRLDATRVRNFGGYRAVITHYLAAFQDPHLSAYFQVSAVGWQWPGFTLKYAGGRYLVDLSNRKDVISGAEASTCDGRPVVSWIDGLTEFYGGPRGRETTRATIAQQFMIDSGNPLYSLPKSCVIGNKEVALTWAQTPDGVSVNVPTRSGESPSTLRDGTLKIEDFGKDGAWVRLGTMLPTTQADAAAFRQVIDGAPALRSKRDIIIDVRGNRGGNYNWFMAFLRSLYGQPYADYYARARLEIAPAMITPPGEGPVANAGFTGETLAIDVPADPPLKMDSPKSSILPSGAQLVQFVAPIASITYPSKAPPSENKARVYVLADFGCASACLSFLDEMMRFPGVTLVGSETHIDRRAGGFPLGYATPSGLTVVRMGRMVREGRRRGENEAWVPGPQYRYPGDIADTVGVKAWLISTVLPQDARPAAVWRQAATLKGPE